METPCILINEETVRRNIGTMISNLKANHINHRPHFKTHKSLYFAKMQLEMGAVGITCASIGEAEVLADGGINDIFIAYPIIGEEKLKRLLDLSRRVTLRTVVNSVEGAKALNIFFAKNNQKINVLIELDGGMNRSGITLSNITAYAKEISQQTALNLTGVMTYRGNIYHKKGEDEYIADTLEEAAELSEAKRLLTEAGIEITELSGGSSFSSKSPQYLHGVTEVRAGTYIFNDVSQLSTGMVSENDCALSVLATVVTKPGKNRAVIDAGSKALSSDLVKHTPGYGYVRGYPGVVIEKLSEEHGYLLLPEETCLNIGDTVHIIPNHVCAVVNLADTFWLNKDTSFTEHKVDARGKSR
jgi:D-serine deaminase-like pyridoxal phosphate-dependent protein